MNSSPWRYRVFFAIAVLLLAAVCSRFLLAVPESGTTSSSMRDDTSVQNQRGPVTLLVPGISVDQEQPFQPWGKHYSDDNGKNHWTGMIGSLRENGLKFGGFIRSQSTDIRLPDCLDDSGGDCDSRQADLFAVQFSRGAGEDGLAYKALELASALKALQEYTACRKVRIVAYSVGGLVARVYLQDALPGLKYSGDVERLITICAPHLGSNAADNFGDLLGFRATSVQTTCELIHRLNQTLELPPDVLFASVVVRGVGNHNLSAGEAYSSFVDSTVLSDLPIGFKEGGDQILHVVTQNLRLAPCSARYEKATRRPVQYALARMPVPSSKGSLPFERTAHTEAPDGDLVQELVSQFLNDDTRCWTGFNSSDSDWARWVAAQSGVCAFGTIETEALNALPHKAKVTQVRLQELDLLGHEDHTWRYRIAGTASWKGNLVGLLSGYVRVSGTISISADSSGRIVGYSTTIDERRKINGLPTDNPLGLPANWYGRMPPQALSRFAKGPTQ